MEQKNNNGRMGFLREAAKGAVSQVQRSALQHCWEFEQDEEVSEVQVAYYNVPDGFRVAKFEPETIAKILQKRRKKFKKTDFCGRVRSRVKENFRFDSTIRRISIFPIIFLTGYYTIQISYQLDLPMLCPSDLLDITNPKGLTELDKIECRLHTEASFKQWNQNSSLFLKLFTFLIGFYVSNIVSRYWDKNISIKTQNVSIKTQNISTKTHKDLQQVVG